MDDEDRRRRHERQNRRRSLSPGRWSSKDRFQRQQRPRPDTLLQSDVAASRPSSFRGDYFSTHVARRSLSHLQLPSIDSSYISSDPLSSSQQVGTSEGSSLRSSREPVSSRSSLLTHASSLGHTSYFSSRSAVPSQGQSDSSSQKSDERDTRPTCSNCSTRETPLWRRDGKGGLLCRYTVLLTTRSRSSRTLI